MNNPVNVCEWWLAPPVSALADRLKCPRVMALGIIVALADDYAGGIPYFASKGHEPHWSSEQLADALRDIRPIGPVIEALYESGVLGAYGPDLHTLSFLDPWIKATVGEYTQQ